MSDIGAQTPENGGESFDRCEQCHAPVDRDQRYCVNCGAHRRGVPDPAAKYMSQVTARSAARNGAAVVAVNRSSRRELGGLGLVGALALALIPVAAAVGIAVGRSSNNQDGKLIRALANRPAQTTTTLAGSPGTAAASGTSTAAATTDGTKRKAAKSKTATARTSKPATVSASTSNGKVTKVTGTKVTASQQTQGSSEAKKVQGATGKNYVQADNNLPSSVVVGP